MSDSNGAANPCDTSKPAVGMYSYDPNGLRVKATINGSTYDYVYDLAGHQIGQWDATNGRTRGEVYLGSMHVATFTPTETYFLHTDQVGTVRALTTHDGTVASKCPSSPWGDGFSCNTPVKTLFTDYERDGETGLDHSWFRQYSSRSGRYHSPDPVLGTPEDPQSWNRYAYVRGNPVNAVDPFGLNMAAPWDDWFGGGGGGGWCPFDMWDCGQGMLSATTWDGDLVQIGAAISDYNSSAAGGLQKALDRYLNRVEYSFNLAVQGCKLSQWDGQIYCGSGDNIYPVDSVPSVYHIARLNVFRPVLAQNPQSTTTESASNGATITPLVQRDNGKSIPNVPPDRGFCSKYRDGSGGGDALYHLCMRFPNNSWSNCVRGRLLNQYTPNSNPFQLVWYLGPDHAYDFATCAVRKP